MANTTFAGAIAEQNYQWEYTCEFCGRRVEKTGKLTASYGFGRNVNTRWNVNAAWSQEAIAQAERKLAEAKAQAESAAALLRLDEAHRDLVGCLFTFGSYAGEAVNWRALDVRDGRVLFLCDDCLDRLPIDTGEGEFTWAGCTLRAWLNGEFLENTFDDAVRGAIADYETYEGVFDRVFLLDYPETKQYCEYEPAKDALYWWLRDDDHNDTHKWNGYTRHFERDFAPSEPSGVRPAFLDGPARQGLPVRNPDSRAQTHCVLHRPADHCDERRGWAEARRRW